MPSHLNETVQQLLNKGVKIPNPGSIDIGNDVSLDRISGENVTMYSGTKIFGNETLILQGAVIGYESPVTIENCQIGQNVHLKGGYFKESVFLQGVQAGYGAHVREGTILEEESSIAHTVGLKQTILFPFVTLGSLINFCDCLMAGGTNRKNHSEVGSSYIHFNFTPNQDKATASLIGDVPSGVMLNQPPIFLGGQGGLVGPSRISFGTVIAAGTVYRKDILKPGKLVFEGSSPSGSIPFSPGVYTSIKRIVINNLFYIANLIALLHWYQQVRNLFISLEFPETLLQGLIKRLNQGIDERMKRLTELAQKMPYSIAMYQQRSDDSQSPILKQKREFYEKGDELRQAIEFQKPSQGDISLRDRFLEQMHADIQIKGKNYIHVIQGLNFEAVHSGIQWLQGIIDNIMEISFEVLPLFRHK